MSKMTERVSRVLCECAGFDPDEPVVMLSKPDGKGARWEFHEPAARAAIKAMRKPTEAMRQAARQVWKDHEAKRIEITGGNGSLPHPDWELHYYHAMIDEALK